MTALNDPFADTGLAGHPRCLMATGYTGGTVQLTPVEMARLQRLQDDARRRDLEMSFQARRRLVATLLGCAPTDVVFSTKADGGPVLDSPRGFSVSIANKAEHTFLALDPAPSTIGADIELVRDIDWRAMLGMVCDEDERKEFLERHEGSESARLDFFRLWTIKEAILKATGAGFRAGPKNIRVPADLYPDAASGQIEAFGEKFDVWAVRRGELAFTLARKLA